MRLIIIPMPKGAGTWNGQFYGPSDEDLRMAEGDMPTANEGNTTPSGFAGEFNAEFQIYGCCWCIRGGKRIIN